MPELDAPRLKTRVDEVLNRWPAVGLAVGVVRDGRLESLVTHGLADIASRRPITADTTFRIASISKTFTAVAVMQLWEQGLVDLDAPANDYLQAYQLVPASRGWRPATVRHLLTHTAGVPEWVHPLRMVSSGWFGESVALGEPLPTLADYYRGRLRLSVEPGTVFTYTDHGFATLGQIVEDVSGQPLHRYLHDRVFEPLGMADSDLLRSARVQTRLATGYRLGSRGARAVTDRQWVAAAASSIYSTPGDLARYVAALVGDGAGEHGRLLHAETLAQMFRRQYAADPRLAGMGLAFFRTEVGKAAGVEHQGVLPGFNSQITLAPEDGVGVLALTNGTRNASTWLPAMTERLLAELVGAPEAGVRTDLPQRPETWAALCGRYRPRAQRTDVQAWAMQGAGVEVVVRHGRLVLRTLSPLPALYRGLVLHPDDGDDPFVFRVDLSRFGMSPAKVVFSRDAAGRVTGVHLDGLPLSADRRPDRTRHRRPS